MPSRSASSKPGVLGNAQPRIEVSEVEMNELGIRQIRSGSQIAEFFRYLRCRPTVTWSMA